MRGWLVLFVLLPVLSLAHPLVRAALFPAWSGFTRAAPGLWVEGPAGDVPADLDRARERVVAFWGTAPAPRILVCTTPACDARLALGPSPGVAYGDLLVVIGARAAERRVEVLAHELSHAALTRRIGRMARLRGTVPVWLDEGLAVLASVAPGYRVECDQGDRAEPPLVTGRHGEIDGAAYRGAACAARDWLGTHGLDDF